jgi:hypothetical protein
MNLQEAQMAKDQLAALTKEYAVTRSGSIQSYKDAKGRGRRSGLPAIGITQLESDPEQYQVNLILQKDMPDNLRKEINQTWGEQVKIEKIKPVRATSFCKGRIRPIAPGLSISHVRSTAGTIGCFVKSSENKSNKIFLLSNNHVLANENDAEQGDCIIQPGRSDSGKESTDRVASLYNYIRLEPRQQNTIDAAIAELEENEADFCSLYQIGSIQGVSSKPILPGMRVKKVGRTTGKTHGIITSIEIVGLEIDYRAILRTFKGVFAIKTDSSNGSLKHFSAPGDSGSLILDEDNMAVGLLFAGNDERTFAIPIQTVFDALKVELCLDK